MSEKQEPKKVKLYKMNKNVRYNKSVYSKGQQLKSSDEGFQDLIDAGHADVSEFDGVVQDEAPLKSEVPVGDEAKSEQAEEHADAPARGRRR